MLKEGDTHLGWGRQVVSFVGQVGHYPSYRGQFFLGLVGHYCS